MDAAGERLLRQGMEALRLETAEPTIRQLAAYADLLLKWNRVYNLTSARTPLQLVTHHLLDSLALVPPLRRWLGERPKPRILDAGSGGGLPGVVVAIACPELSVTCVDAVQKKAAFVQTVAGSLALANLDSRHGRVEALTEPFDVIVSRAFASLARFTQVSAPALAGDGVWIAMKGHRPESELAELAPEVAVFHVEQVVVPGLDAERCLVWMRRRRDANEISGGETASK